MASYELGKSMYIYSHNPEYISYGLHLLSDNLIESNTFGVDQMC